MHRSGTSCVARLVNMMGAYFAPEGKEMLSQPDNPKGFWEREDVVQLNDEILELAGATWDNVAHLDFAKINTKQKGSIDERIQSIVLDMDAHRPWFLKDPRMCLVFPFWKARLEVPVSLFVYRNPIQIARSLAKRNKIPQFTGIALWEYYMVTALNAAQGTKLLVTRYEDIMTDPVTEVERLTRKLEKIGVTDLRIPEREEITSFITPSLFHNKEDSGLYPDYLNSNQLDLIDIFANDELGDSFHLKISQSSKEVLSDYFSHKRIQEDLTIALNRQKQSKKELASLQQEHDKAVHELNTANLSLEKSIQTVAEKEEHLKEQAVELDKTKQQLSQKNECLNQQTSELEKNKNERDNLSWQLSELHSRHEDLTQSHSSLQDKYNKVISQHEAIRGVCELLNSQIKSLQAECNQERDKVAQFNSWLLEIDRDVRDIFSSIRWKAGNSVSSLIELVLLRFNQRTAKDHIEEILNEYANFLANSEKTPLGNQNQISQESNSRWETFCRLTLAALKNPAQTARLLDAERIKNLYITMFKQSPNVRENIFDYYLKLYGDTVPSPPHNVIPDKDNKPFPDKPFTLPSIDDPLVSVIIPVYNQWQYTKKCIYSVAKSAVGVKYEIILADDHSTDDTANAAKFFPGLKIIKTPQNSGFLKNCNNAAGHAAGDYIVLLNNDTVVHENWLQAMLEVMENPRVGMTGSKLIYPDGKMQEAGGIIWNDASGWNYGRLDNPEKPEYNYIKQVDYISGASIMVRSSLWKDLGGFDERYVPAYYEDTDLAFAIREKGFDVVFTPFSVVTHFEGQSHGTDESTGIKRYQVVNHKKFYEKWQHILETEHYPNAENVFLVRDRSQKKKTMLVVDHYVPHYDKDAGSRSTFQYLQWFVETGFNVKFIGDNFYQHEPYTTDLQKLGIEVLHGPWYAQNWQQWLKENGRHIDYIYLHRPHIAPKYIEAARKYSGAKIIYFGHDLHYLRIERQYEIEKDENLKAIAAEWKKKEFSIFEKVDVIYYPSLVEKKEVQKHFPKKCIRAIPLNIYDTVQLKDIDFEEKKGLMFVGGFGHPPNLDGVLWFINEVFPLILDSDSSIHFTVVGSKIPDEVKNLASDNIIIAGEVSDAELEIIYDQSRLAIVPVRYGAGIKGKVLEALYKQVPVVTTDIGAEGLPTPDNYLCIGNTPEEFATHVLNAYSDKNSWKNLVGQGVECLNKYFSKERVREIWSQDVSF